MAPDLSPCIYIRPNLAYLALETGTTFVHDEFGDLVPSNGPARNRFIYGTLWAGTPDEHALHAAQWALWELEERQPRTFVPHSTCTLLPGNTESVIQTAGELLVHRVGAEPPGELLYRLNLRGEPGVYITRSDLLALMTGAAELLNLELQPRAEAVEEGVPA